MSEMTMTDSADVLSHTSRWLLVWSGLLAVTGLSIPSQAEVKGGLFQPVRPPRRVQVVAHRGVTRAVGDCLERKLRALVAHHGGLLRGVEGKRHMASLCFHDLDATKRFVRSLIARGFDISAQTYKASCPPNALTKLPIIAGHEVVDYVVGRMDETLGAM